jgi:hypothetical protein
MTDGRNSFIYANPCIVFNTLHAVFESMRNRMCSECFVCCVCVYVQDVQLKSGPYFNMSNLFTKIYNMLYYTTKLYLQYVLEMMSTYFSAFIDTFYHVPRIFSWCSFIYFFDGTSNIHLQVL